LHEVLCVNESVKKSEQSNNNDSSNAANTGLCSSRHAASVFYMGTFTSSCQSYNYIKNRFFRLKVKDYFELGVSFQKLTERETFVHLHLP